MAGAWLSQVDRRLREPPADGGSDAELLARFGRDRDGAAFELLVWRHGGMVLSACRRALGHHHDAEDAFQATFLVLARKADDSGRRDARGGPGVGPASRPTPPAGRRCGGPDDAVPGRPG